MPISIHNAPNFYARIAGIFYLVIILAGIVGQVFIRGSLIAPDDAEATVGNILAASTLWRAGMLVDVLMHMCDVPLMIILYFLFKPVHKPVAMVGLVLNIIQTAILVANKLTLLLPVLILSHGGYQAAFTATQINAQIMLLIDVHNHGFALGLIFFALACCCYGYLLFNSSYFSKFLGILICIAGVSYLAYSLTLFTAPTYAEYASALFILCLLAELSFGLWLVCKGVNYSLWRNRLNTNSQVAV